MKILLISSGFFKAEGSIAKGIASVLKNHEVYFFSTLEIKRREEEFQYLLSHVDVVHWLFNVAHLKGEKMKSFFLDCNAPQVATVHHVCPQELDKISKASKANLIHVVSNEWADFVTSQTDTKVQIAHLGIHPNDFKHINSKSYNSGTFIIGMMGFYPGKYNRKRPDRAIEIFKELKRREFDFEVVLQGGGWGDYIPILIKNNIPHKHLHVKSGSEILKFFEHIHLYLCTSDYEGGPLPVIESLECSIPVVSTDIGIARDALYKGGGLIVKNNEVITFCDNIQNIQSDVNLYKRLKDESKIVSKNFHWHNLISDYNSIYETAIEQWESSNSKKWINRENKLSANYQRNCELSHDNITQSLMLLRKKSDLKKITKFFKILFKDKYLSLSFRINAFKRFMSEMRF